MLEASNRWFDNQSLSDNDSVGLNDRVCYSIRCARSFTYKTSYWTRTNITVDRVHHLELVRLSRVRTVQVLVIVRDRAVSWDGEFA